MQLCRAGVPCLLAGADRLDKDDTGCLARGGVMMVMMMMMMVMVFAVVRFCSRSNATVSAADDVSQCRQRHVTVDKSQ